MPTRRRQDDHPILIGLNVAIENMRWYFFKVYVRLDGGLCSGHGQDPRVPGKI